MSFESFANKSSKAVGSSKAFIIAILIIIFWLFSGLFFDWSEMHSLFINTFTTIISFLLLFLLQYSQSKDTKAIHLKLDEIIKSIENASNEVAGIELKTEAELKKLEKKL